MTEQTTIVEDNAVTSEAAVLAEIPEPATDVAETLINEEAHPPSEHAPASAERPHRPNAPHRMSPAEEENAAAALKEKLSGSKEDIEAALNDAMQLPWNVAVKGVSLAWPELNATAKRSFFPALNRLDTDPGRRLRFSLSRGLYKIDPPSGIKIAASLCSALKKASEDKGLAGKDRQSFFNVFIGKGKPWILQWKWDDFKPAEVSALVFCALSSVFQGNSPPLTQASIIRWTASSGKLDKVPDDLTNAIRREIGRWKSRLKDEVRRELPEAPDWLKELLAIPQAAQASEQPEQDRAHPQSVSNGESQKSADIQPARGEQDARRPLPKQRALQAPPPKVSSDPISLLRQLENQFQSMKNELANSKAQIRQRDEEIRKLKRGGGNRRRGGKSDGENPQLEDPQYDTEEITRHNRQLEEHVAELQSRLADLAEDHEDVAHSRQAGPDGSEAAGMEQVRMLIGLKLEDLHKHFADLCAGPQNEVLAEHYRALVYGIFVELRNLGVQFTTDTGELPLRASRSLKSWKSE